MGLAFLGSAEIAKPKKPNTFGFIPNTFGTVPKYFGTVPKYFGIGPSVFFDHVADAVSKNLRRASHEHQTQTPATSNYNIVYCVRASAPSVEPIHELSSCPQQPPSTRWAIARDYINCMIICHYTTWCDKQLHRAIRRAMGAHHVLGTTVAHMPHAE